MRLLRHLLILLLLLGAVSACKKEEVAPQTGNLLLRFAYTPSVSGATYLLFTEQVWTSTGRTATALRTGELPRLTTGNATVEIKDLNAGNYVFVLGSASWSVQVTAGKTNEVNR
jgi:hypothetical protein